MYFSFTSGTGTCTGICRTRYYWYCFWYLYCFDYNNRTTSTLRPSRLTGVLWLPVYLLQVLLKHLWIYYRDSHAPAEPETTSYSVSLQLDFYLLFRLNQVFSQPAISTKGFLVLLTGEGLDDDLRQLYFTNVKLIVRWNGDRRLSLNQTLVRQRCVDDLRVHVQQ